MVKWKKVDPLLLIAALAPTAFGRQDAMSRISAAYNVTHLTLIKRLHWLGYKYPPVTKGFGALREWEREMLGIIRVYQAQHKLRQAIVERRWAVRKEIEDVRNRSVTTSYAAKLLGVRVEILRGWVVDLELIERDKQGLLPLPRVREFFETHWWFIKSYRYWKRSEYWEKRGKQ